MARWSSALSGAEPETARRRRASSPTRLEAARRWYIVGTPKNIVAWYVVQASSTASTSNRGSRTTEEPASNDVYSATHRPCPWKMGRACTRRSSALHRHVREIDWLLASRFPCVSTAPLGAPVVPEV